MITPRATRLLRAPDLRALQQMLLGAIPRGWDARSTAVILPARSAASELRRRLEDAGLRNGGAAAVVLPDLLTRSDLYVRLHAWHADAPPLLNEFEREVLLRLAADDARSEGAVPPFALRPGLVAAILEFYDELRRHGRTLDAFDRTLTGRLEPGSDTDKGAARLLAQTRFLAAAFAAFERRVGDSGAIDEHALRALLLSSESPGPYRHVIVATPDHGADPRGLWPADFDLLARLAGVERIDVMATERGLEAGLYGRIHDALPGIEDVREPSGSRRPVLVTPEDAADDRTPAAFVYRDREEELSEAIRRIKVRPSSPVDSAASEPPPLDQYAIIFSRPLPYLYSARQAFASARMPYQATDALPLAAEPFAAAVDLIFAVCAEDASRTALVELLSAAQWAFNAPDAAPITRHAVAALDGALREAKYLGSWERLHQLADRLPELGAGAGRAAQRWRAAGAALLAAAAAGRELEAIRTATSASGQLQVLLDFIARHERAGGAAPDLQRHLRARAAILGALTSLKEAHARYDDRPVAVSELIATARRWMEGQTFSPRTGREGVLLVDDSAATFADVHSVRIVGLIEAEWPARASGNIFYPGSLLRDLGWPAETDRLAAARAAFHDLLFLGRGEVSLSTFMLEEDAVVAPSPFLDDVRASGLATVAEAPRSPVRVFDHEALSLEPLVSGAVSDSAAAWLTLRQSRTPQDDGRYHGTLGARETEVYAVSRIERYLECPFKYFAGHLLRLEEERGDESGLTPQERGQLLHEVFERFFARWSSSGAARISADNLADAVALFAEVAEGTLARLPEADRALERSYLLGSAAAPGLAERAFAFEVEHGVEVVERLLEHEFSGSFVFAGAQGPTAVQLRGKADRIDLLADGSLRIVDYKLGRAPKASRALQLPVYSVCAAQQLEGRHGRSWSVGRAGYVAFREKNPFVELGGRSGNLAAALAEGQQRLVETIARIEAGQFPPAPDEAWTCTRCGFPHVCRKDYVGDE